MSVDRTHTRQHVHTAEGPSAASEDPHATTWVASRMWESQVTGGHAVRFRSIEKRQNRPTEPVQVAK